MFQKIARKFVACGYRVYKRVIIFSAEKKRLVTKFIPFTFFENIKISSDIYTLYIGNMQLKSCFEGRIFSKNCEIVFRVYSCIQLSIYNNN